ncbi:MAG: hypothetical protein LUE93_10565 [Bacteroides sp.]|nr:hypothetical protein [Bacteroides sp.]
MKIKMKFKFFMAATAFLAMGAASTFAQTGAETGTKFGSGQDSINCLRNISIYAEYVKTNNFQDAYLPWKSVFEECPLAQLRTYTNGVRIVKWFLANENDPAKKKAYFDELMNVYDQRMKYFPDYQNTPAAAVLGMKGMDYMQLAPERNINEVYPWLEESVKTMKEDSEYYVLMYFMEASAEKFKTDPDHKEKFVDDFMTTSAFADGAIKKAEKEADKANYETAKNNIEAFFINSGVADCDMLQNIYGQKVEENQNDKDYLKNVVSVMRFLRCTEQEAYFNAAYYLYKIEPSAEAAAGCAYMSFKKGDINTAIQFFDEAINLESDNEKKAEYAYQAAAILSTDKKLSQARNYAQKAISFNPNYGAPYILIAQLYATSPKWSDEAALNSCTFYLVIDKLQRARSVDPSCAEEAQKLINTYSAYTPAADKLFMMGLKKGDSITIGGWIGETTTIR